MARSMRIEIVGDASGLKKALGDAGASVDKFGSETQSKIGGLGEGISGSLGESLGGIGGVMSSKLGALGGVAAGALAGVAVAAGAAFTDALGQAMDMEAGQDKLAAQLNLSAQDSERFGKIAGDLYAGAYGESLGEVNNAIAQVGNGLVDLGTVSDEELQSVTAGALDIASAFDTDVNEVVRSASSLFRSGLAPDAQTALDMITTGFQNGLNVGDDFLDTLNEYAAPFKDIGLDASTSLGVLNAAMDAGAYNTDKAADAIKEFGIRAIDGSKSTSEAYQSLGLDADAMSQAIAAGGPAAKDATSTIIQSLMAMRDPVKQDAAGVALFGSMWEDLGPQVIGALDPAGKAMENVSGATAKMGETLADNAATKWESFKRGAGQGLVNFLGGTVIPAFEAIGDVVMPVFEKLRDAFGRISTVIGDSVGPVLSDLAAAIGPVLTQLGERLTPAFNAIRDAILPVFEQSGGAVENARGIFERFRAIVEQVVQTISVRLIELQPIFDQLRGVVQTAFDAINAIITVVVEVITNTLRTAFEIFRMVFEVGLAVVTGMWERFGGHLITFLQVTWENLKLLISAALQVVHGIFDVFAGIFTGDWDRVWTGIKDIFGGIWEGIKAVLSQALNVITTVLGAAVAAISLAWSYAWGAIRNYFRDRWEDIKTAANLAVNWVKTTIVNVTGEISKAWNTTWGGIRDFLGGVWDGIKKAAGDTMGALQGIVRGAVDEIGRIWGNIKLLFTDPLQFVANAVNNWAGKIEAVAGKLGLNIDIPHVSFHSGGVVGEDRGTRSPGRIRPGERFALLQDGEGVLQRGAMTRIGKDNFYKLNRGEVDFLEPETGGPFDFVKGAVFEAIDAARRLIAETARPAVEAAVRAMDDAGARFGPVGRIGGGGGRRAAEAALDWLRGVEAEADKVGMGTLPGAGKGWERLAAYIASTNVPHRITSTVRPGSITASGNVSRHSMGLAIDVAGPTSGNDSPQLGRIFHAFLPIEKQLNELIYAGPQTSFNVKRGKRVGKYAQAQHHDHVHAALADGGNVVRAGRFLVGEHGPEVVGLPRGSRVAPLADSGASVNVRTLNVNLQGVFDLTDPAEQRRLALRLRELLRRLDREVA